MGIIRLCLALSVISAHCGRFLGTLSFVGVEAVQASYIISGFFMTLVLNKKYVATNNSYWLFISNRLLRLYPVYWVVLILTILSFGMGEILLNNHEKFGLYKYTNVSSFCFLVFSNISIFFQDIVLFLGIDPSTGDLFFASNFRTTHPPLHAFIFVPQAWSMGMEIIFYFIAPFILRKNIKTIVVLILASLALRFYLYNCLHLQKDPWSYRFFPTELVFFLLGYCSFKLVKAFENAPKILGMVLLVYMLVFTTCYGWLPNGKIPLSPFSVKQLSYYISLVVSIPVLFNIFERSSFDNLLSKLLFPMYISHIFVYYVLKVIPLNFLHNGTSVAIATIIFSFVLTKLVSDSVENYRQARLKSSAVKQKVAKKPREKQPKVLKEAFEVLGA